MLRVIDLAGAVAARGWPTGLTAEIDLDVEDPLCPWNSGSHRLVLRGGTGHLEDLGGGSPEHVGVESGGVDAAATAVTLPGLALLYAGGVTSSALRRTGLITGGSAGSDTLLDAAFAGPRPAVLDYF
jgi:hypothetical protein